MAFTVLRGGLKTLHTLHFYPGKICFLHNGPRKTNWKSNTGNKKPDKGRKLKKYPNRPDPRMPPSRPLPPQSKASADPKLDDFVNRWRALIEQRYQAIREEKRKRLYRPYTEQWAESFYHIKGKHTRATCFSQDQIPILLTKITNPNCRRDFLLYKDIPTMIVISDFHQNFGWKELPEIDDLNYNPFALTVDATLPTEYRSDLVDEDLRKGFHLILDSPSVRIYSHVTEKELFHTWWLDTQERERQLRSIYRRNKWPFTEKVEAKQEEKVA